MGNLVSLKPSEAVAGGLIGDVNVEVVESRFCQWDYQGTQAPVPALHWKMVDLDTKEEYDQYWSAGAAKDWIPSEDGKGLVAVGNQTSMRKGSNTVLLLESCINGGFPEDKMGVDISVFDGMHCHMIRKPAPKRDGLPNRKRDDGKEFDPTILLVDTISKLPWEKAKAKPAAAAGKPGPAAAAGKPAAATAAPAAANEDVAAKAAEVVMGIVAESGSIAKANLAATVYKKLAGDPLQKAVVALVGGNPKFVESIEGLAVVDGVVQFG